MGKKNIMSFSMGVLAYLIFILLAYLNFELFSLIPVLLIIGVLSSYFILGTILGTKGIWEGRMSVLFIYGVGGMIYFIGRIMVNTSLVATFRRMMPQVYHSIEIVGKWTNQVFSRDILIALLMIVFLILSLLALEFGKRIGISTKQRSLFMYNMVLVWVVHFYLFMLVHGILKYYPTLMNDAKQKLILGAVMTVILFISYFFLGKACRTLKNKILQCLSSSAITLTAFGLYVLGLLLIMDVGIYERYMLPIATSYIGTLCRALGIAVGANGKVVAQYGFLASGIMIIVPTIMITVGKLTSISNNEKIEGQATLM